MPAATIKPVDLGLPSLRTSERRDFKRCPQRWWWGWREGLKPHRDKNPLWFGSGIHIALADWYLKGAKRGPHPAETWEKYVGDEQRMIPQDYEEDGRKFNDAKELGLAMLTGYVEHYGKDDQWEILAVEQAFKYLLRDPLTRKAMAYYLGTFDGCYRDRRTGEVWLLEHKTAAGIQTGHLPLDDQAGSYLMVITAVLRKLKLIGPEDHVVGIMYNFLEKRMPDDRPIGPTGERHNKPQKAHFLEALDGAGIPSVRQNMKIEELEQIASDNEVVVFGEVSKIQPKPLFIREPVHRSIGDQRNMHHRVIAEVNAMAMFESGALELYKNPTKDCSWDCDFYRMCQLHESDDDWEEYRDAAFTRRDPYADHRAARKSA